ncbi:MAG: Crp/Fnr family transcriptional regulator [Candidatus Omnitrophica bacterium]|nr:Crp/Fnr family transcriptional regulator [Candidatus Omnitrophota bacterium]
MAQDKLISDLKSVPLFKGFSESELGSVKSCLREKTFDKGEVLFREGECCHRVFIVRSGRVKLCRTSSTGREQTLETLGPGDTCACNPGSSTWSCSSTAEAVTSVQVWFLSRDDYIRMVNSNSKISHSLNLLFAKRLQSFSSLIEEVSLKDVKKRLVKFLLDMLHASVPQRGEENLLSLPFTREEIAQRLGAARETVARYLSELKRDKLIDIKPKQIVILDKKGLEKLLF